MTDNLNTVELVRKPFYVTAVQVTDKNMEAVAAWCGGDVRLTDRSRAKKLIKCVHVDILRATADWQKQARVGDWVVKAGAGYKVYTDKALKNSFDSIQVNPGHTDYIPSNPDELRAHFVADPKVAAMGGIQIRPS